MVAVSRMLLSWKGVLAGVFGAIAIAIVMLTLSSSAASAGSCPKPCWVELQCCCITPCPVKDATAKQQFDEILQNIKEANKLYGVRMPGWDSPTSIKTPIDPAQAASAGLNAMQQAVRNVMRGPEMDQGMDVKLEAFAPHVAEIEIKGDLPSVTADIDGDGLATIEEKSKQLDEANWTNKLLGRADERTLRGARSKNALLSNVDAMAYVLVKKAEIAAAAKKAAELSQRLDQSLTLSDEWRLNAEAKALVTADMQALQEVMTYVIDGAASRSIMMEEEVTKESRASSNAGTPPYQGGGGDPTYKFAQARSSCEVATRRAVAEHNELTQVNGLKAYLPSLTETVDEHEARKQHAWDENGAILSILGRLYVDPARAWSAIQSELASRDKTSYFEQGRYASARAAAAAIVPDLFAQSARTRFGERKKNANCTKQLQEQAACLPYAGPAAGGNWLKPVYDINAYYAAGDRQYDAYNRIGGVNTAALAEKPMPLPDLPQQKTMGINSEPDPAYEQALAERKEALAHNWQLSIDQALILVQYRQEAMKRKLYWDAMRRGDDGDFGPAMSAEMRQELLSKSPACFEGPLPMNAANYAAYRDWFDVSPNCGWRTWSAGAYAGERIGHEFLGGTDSAIWAIQNELLDYQTDHPKGRAGVEEWANGAAGFCASAQSLAPAANRQDVLPELGNWVEALKLVMSDKLNTKIVNLP